MSSGNCALIHAITHITEPILGDSLNYLQWAPECEQEGNQDWLGADWLTP